VINGQLYKNLFSQPDVLTYGTTIFGLSDQGALMGLSSFMLVTSLMICGAILLNPAFNKWLNIFVGLVMTVFLAFFAYSVDYYFSKVFASIEALLTLLIAWYAVELPKRTTYLTAKAINVIIQYQHH
jgi:hypothetical protein